MTEVAQASDNSVNKAMLVEARVANESVGLAYVLWFFLGGVAAHNFYLGRTGLALIESALLWVGFLGAIAAPPLIGLSVIGGILIFVDLFTIPGAVRKDMDRIRTRVASTL